MTRSEHPRGGGCIKLIINDEHVARILAAKRRLLQAIDTTVDRKLAA